MTRVRQLEEGLVCHSERSIEDAKSKNPFSCDARHRAAFGGRECGFFDSLRSLRTTSSFGSAQEKPPLKGSPQRRMAFVGRGEAKTQVEFSACGKWNIVACASTREVARSAGGRE